MTEEISKRSKILRLTSFLFFLLALILIILLRLFQSEHFLEWYDKYTDTLVKYQQWVETNGATALTVFIILINYVLKAVIPWFPLTTIMFISGVIFEWRIAMLINLAGCIILFTIKYFWGKKWGGGNAEKILAHYDKAHIFLEKGKLGSKMTLYFARVMPFIPVNSVSQLYGTTTMPFWQYLIISVIGFSYKLFSYTTIARNVFNPLSYGFILPIISLLIVFGLTLLSINGIISATSPLLKKYQQRKEQKSNE